jgi:hypothetical protein
MKPINTGIEFAEKSNRDITQLLNYIEHDAATSKDCLDGGVMTNTAQQIATFLSNPVKSMLDSYDSMGAGIKNVVEQIIFHFLNFNKPVIYKVYKESNTLQYYISFENDTFELRERFFKFLEQYEELEFADKFPVYFQFIPQNIADKKSGDKEVRLIDAETH